MISLAAEFGIPPERSALRSGFLGWQCRVRQMMMREGGGRPSDAVMPEVTLDGEDAPLGRIITVLSKAPAWSVTPELTHIAKKTNDPMKWREEALTFFSATYFQRPHEFSDILTASFAPGSEGAARLRAAPGVTLSFDAYGQRYDLSCKVWKLARRNPLRAATIAHNRLFNPALHPDADILGFEPDWEKSTADPAPA
ncbi:hypothetical protein G5B40_19230 [Pikeienuella piscinae]|uniref:Uncharacterized protein n=1 Tax=Pikeienuella piscinae TaxID=2748098 RepID=A0A7M3T5V7_9RHOB|nr:hypothetical protein [Pikeienuella piscinae]QIE57388.1 hypothetical protein G5B40_19230 [Pikeienuella piscinae]